MVKKVESYKMTCDACPSQWEGRAVDGTRFYIRYRYGWLTVRLNGSETVLEKDIGSALDGVMADGEMFEHVARVLDFTEAGHE